MTIFVLPGRILWLVRDRVAIVYWLLLRSLRRFSFASVLLATSRFPPTQIGS
jgi:hypothetical protein